MHAGVVGKTCPAGSRIATLAEVTAGRAALCAQVLSDGIYWVRSGASLGSFSGKVYGAADGDPSGCGIFAKDTDRDLGGVICTNSESRAWHASEGACCSYPTLDATPWVRRQ